MITLQEKAVSAGELVSTAHVDTLLRNYKQERWTRNSQHIGKPDSLSIWFSMDKIEEFLAVAKENGSDGVRVYFGAYSADDAQHPDFASRQTVAMVATKRKMTSNGASNKNLYYVNKAGENSIVALNAGTPCPPYCFQEGSGGSIGITIIDKGDGMEVV